MGKTLAMSVVSALMITSFYSQSKTVHSVCHVSDSLVVRKYEELPLGAVKPKGWLLNQLNIMKNGSTGHLDETHAKLRNDNGWLGGKGDGWEETPYWLDGAVPLAYILNDKPLQKKVLKYINWVIENQRPSGYFGPITPAEREKGLKMDVANSNLGEDWWPKMVMLKVMQQYYSATKDPRVIKFMTSYFNYQLKALKTTPIGTWTEWAPSRGSENMLVAQWLFRITKDKGLIDLAELIKTQSFNWSDMLGNRDWVINAAALQNYDKWITRHGVNVAMALKEPALNFERTHDLSYLSALRTGFNDLMTLHGLPMGMFSADEDLHGNDPTQGTELCAIVESMFSLEEIIAITGDTHYMDALERMTFNALPTQTTDDYNMKQYFQNANQIQISRGVFNFSLPFNRQMNCVYGALSGYSCCLANMHQGWTKFTSHLWYSTPGKGIAALVYSPSVVTATLGKNNTEVTINEVTNYPFDDTINFEFSTRKAVEFPFQLRIPSWCREAVVLLNGSPLQKGKGGELITLKRIWKNGDKITLDLPMELSTSNWGKNSRVVERGPLVYALKVEEKWEKGHEKSEGDYFSVFPKTAWNYGLTDDVVREPAKNLEVKFVKPVSSSFVWNIENAPIEISAPGKKIPGWKVSEDGVAPQPVTDREGIYKGRVSDDTERITLIPYGCTKIRIVAFPVVKAD